MANKIRTEGLLQSQVYENGNLYSISIADLKGNEIAITQLVNDYNTKVQTIENCNSQKTFVFRITISKCKSVLCDNCCIDKYCRVCNLMLWCKFHYE